MPLPNAAGLDAFVHQVVDDWRKCPFCTSMVHMLEFTEKTTRTPAALTRDNVAALRASGWSDPAIHDAVQVISYFNYINRVADALGVEPEPDLPTWGRG